jgi:hypothetical protein
LILYKTNVLSLLRKKIQRIKLLKIAKRERNQKESEKKKEFMEDLSIDYVFVYEMCHLKEQNHTMLFWGNIKIYYN